MVFVSPSQPLLPLLSDLRMTALRHSSSWNVTRDASSHISSLSSNKFFTPAVAVQCSLLLSTLDGSQLLTDIASPVSNIPLLNVLDTLLNALLFDVPLFPCVPFEYMDNGCLTTSIQSTPSMALFRATIVLGARLQNIKCHNIMHIDVSLQVMPVTVQRCEGTATIMAWNHFASTQPTGPTVNYLSPWWRGSSCQTYFSEYWKKDFGSADCWPIHRARHPMRHCCH